jgi:hypothetical protein
MEKSVSVERQKRGSKPIYGEIEKEVIQDRSCAQPIEAVRRRSSCSIDCRNSAANRPATAPTTSESKARISQLFLRPAGSRSVSDFEKPVMFLITVVCYLIVRIVDLTFHESFHKISYIFTAVKTSRTGQTHLAGPCGC